MSNLNQKISHLLVTGGERAARDLELLTDQNITAVVNCTDDLEYEININLLDSTISFHRNYHTGKLSYFTFNIAWWRKYVMDGVSDNIN